LKAVLEKALRTKALFARPACVCLASFCLVGAIEERVFGQTVLQAWRLQLLSKGRGCRCSAGEAATSRVGCRISSAQNRGYFRHLGA
jgi:hypothetical protein